MKKIHLKLYKLIAIGHLWINLPVVIVLLGIPILAALLNINTTLKIVLVILSILGGFASAWLLWSLLVTKWRIWAFSRADEDDWPKLNELAVKNRLIWDGHSVFELTEWRTEAEHRHITAIYERIAELEQVEEIKLDLQTPDYFGYRFNRLDIVAELSAMLLVLIVAVFMLLSSKIALGLIMLALIAFVNGSYKYIPHIFHTGDCLILSSEGVFLEFPHPQLIRWDDMDRIIVVKEGKKLVIIMDEAYDFEKRIFDLYGYAIRDYDLLLKRIRVFVGRYQLRVMEDDWEDE